MYRCGPTNCYPDDAFVWNLGRPLARIVLIDNGLRHSFGFGRTPPYRLGRRRSTAAAVLLASRRKAASTVGLAGGRLRVRPCRPSTRGVSDPRTNNAFEGEFRDILERRGIDSSTAPARLYIEIWIAGTNSPRTGGSGCGLSMSA